MSCPWTNLGNTALYERHEEDGSRYLAVEGFGGRGRWHVIYSTSDGGQFETWNDDREAAVRELRKLRGVL